MTVSTGHIPLIFTPERDIKTDDRDERDAAYESGELTDEHGKPLCTDITAVHRGLFFYYFRFMAEMLFFCLSVMEMSLSADFF